MNKFYPNRRIVSTLFLMCILAGCAERPDTISEVGMVFDLKQGIVRQWPANQKVEVVLLKMEPDKGRAMLRIFSPDNSEVDDGWVDEGGFATFSPLIGPSGLEVVKVYKSFITVEAHSSK